MKDFTIKYVLGLDVGIGSVGWAVIRVDKDYTRIEDCGVRIFESGEVKEKDRTSQERRQHRSTRRLISRRSQRKARLKAHLQNIGLVSEQDITAYFDTADSDVIALRVKALDEKITPQELAACLIHISNYRGYRDFYEVTDTEELSKKELEEEQKENQKKETVNTLMSEKQYRTPAEMILKDKMFASEGSEYRSYRNRNTKQELILINRKMLIDEANKILEQQSKHYSCLTERNRKTVIKIIFEQRDFEDGPGKVSDPFRKYTGFLDTVGKCRFFPDENRGCRFSMLADVFAAVNVLSQYLYLDRNNAPCFNAQLACDLITSVLKNGKIDVTTVKEIAKNNKVTVVTKTADKDSSLSGCFKYLKILKPIMENDGYCWNDLCNLDVLGDEENPLNRIGRVVAESVTPERRRKKLKQLGLLSKEAINKLIAVKFSGTVNVSDKYMMGVVDAFLTGQLYGQYQIQFTNNTQCENKGTKKLPPFEEDFEFFKNPVVFRSINETRKIINAIVEQYGSPCAINIETANDLNRSFEMRNKIQSEQNKRRKEKEDNKKKIAELLHIDVSEVSGKMVDRYVLGETQGWKCMYSGRKIDDIASCLNDRNHEFEIDHIVPYSLILDNTLNNKVLVYSYENQKKGQRTPLMYLDGERRKSYIGTVNEMRRKGIIQKVKFDYLMQPDLNSEKMSTWKSRNINDTRYISKFLVDYLQNNLLFAPSISGLMRWQKVYAVKGQITSLFRKLWLYDTVWGTPDKEALKKETYLDHAVDAVVIGCCLPAYVEIAMQSIKLKEMRKRCRGNSNNDKEYQTCKRDCLNNISRYYQIPADEINTMLEHENLTPSLIGDIRTEVLKRFFSRKEYCEKKQDDAKADGTKFVEPTYEQTEQYYQTLISDYYKNDAYFASRLRMLQISCKPERKLSGTLTADNPVGIREINGEQVHTRRVEVGKLKKSDLEHLLTGDTDLKESLQAVFACAREESLLADVYPISEQGCFVTQKRKRVKKVTLITTDKNTYYKKEIKEGNFAYLDAKEYYCVEVYKTKEGKTATRGIPRIYVQKQNGKMVLSQKFVLPQDYDSHITYLFKNDFIEIYNDKGIKARGYYRSVFNINESRFCVLSDNAPKLKSPTINATDKIRKYDIDILGKIKEEIKQCGEPFLSATEKK